MLEMATRDLPPDEARSLEPGSEHYTAYVGPPGDYDSMGATQFRLLCTLGLRENHHLLDFGCGSLRAGRLLIPYLKAGHYCGIDPNRWLIDDAVEREIGADLARIKKPQFFHHDTFTCREPGIRFDYILAQSIFSHCGADLVGTILAEFEASLADDGIVAATFIHSPDERAAKTGEGWVYPECVSHPPESVAGWVESANLAGARIPWYHPRQSWWLLARDPKNLPRPDQHALLRGAVLTDPASSPNP